MRSPNWFVAIPVAADGWLDGLIADAPDELRVFHADDLHMTVAFLGPCGEEAALAAFDTAEPWSSPAVAITLAALSPMGNPRRPSALSVLLERGGAEVSGIVTQLRPAMWRAAGATPDERPAKPHVTVARPRRRADDDERGRALAWAAGKPPLEVDLSVSRLALYTRFDGKSPPEGRRRAFRIVSSRALSHEKP
jgi:RNA 2',3'-cyclic 3'-phosphodiesterase